MSESKISEKRPVGLIVGASSGVGRALASTLAANGYDLYLTARDKMDLEAVASDCRIKHESKINTHVMDLESSDFSTQELEKLISETLGPPESVFLVAGANDIRDEFPLDASVLEKMNRINFLGPAKVAALALSHHENWNLQNLVVCSSIAAAVPRGRNTAYASAKCALEAYSLGMRHALASTNLKIQVYRLGYVDTSLSYGQKLLFPPVDPKWIAKKISENLGSDRGLFYLPGYWRFIVAILQALPWVVLKRLRF